MSNLTSWNNEKYYKQSVWYEEKAEEEKLELKPLICFSIRLAANPKHIIRN